MKLLYKPMVLIILDGWGYSDNMFYNAIHSAQKPNWDTLWEQCPHTLINASGVDVGLPGGQMGNSEVGHMNIGAGRLVDQEFSRISKAIESGSFFENPTLIETMDIVVNANKSLHIAGLLSPGGVHGHEDHIYALLELAVARKVKKLYLHLFLDGRDTPPKSATDSIRQLYQKIHKFGVGKIASIIGRYYAMDRNKHWDRTQSAYELITQGKADFWCKDPFVALDMAYARSETDEFVRPTAILSEQNLPHKLEDGDAIIFTNYRADRARQLARALTKTSFKSFQREYFPQLSRFISLTSYKANYEFPVAFLPESLPNVFGEYIASLGLKQLRIAETEKYAHVTFFFNGGEERVFEGEDRILVPSPHVRTYDKSPAMSAHKITQHLIKAVKSRQYDVVICNFANADMVGHTGNFYATIEAIEVLDKCLGDITRAVQGVGGEILITADHGNAEQLRGYATEKVRSQSHTAHTCNPVPLVYIGRPVQLCKEVGTLSDIAPTMLNIIGLEVPSEMTGTSILKLNRALPHKEVIGK